MRVQAAAGWLEMLGHDAYLNAAVDNSQNLHDEQADCHGADRWQHGFTDLMHDTTPSGFMRITALSHTMRALGSLPFVDGMSAWSCIAAEN